MDGFYTYELVIGLARLISPFILIPVEIWLLRRAIRQDKWNSGWIIIIAILIIWGITGIVNAIIFHYEYS